MPESRKRKKNGKVVSDDIELKAWTEGIPLSPSWWAPLLSAFLVAGLVWLMVFYISYSQYPIPGIGWWNMLIGLGLMMTGFLMTLRWR